MEDEIEVLIEKMVHKKRDIVKLKIPVEMEWFIDVCFQKSRFKLIEAISKLERSNSYEVEFLPCIYIGYRYKHKKLRSFIDTITGKHHYIIRILNKKDSFVLESRLERKEMPEEKDKESSDIEDLDPRIFRQPSRLGGGECGGCPILDFFSRLGLEEKGSNGDYYFWDIADLVEATEKEDFFLDLCKASQCYKTYESIVENGYNMHLDQSKSITVDVKDGLYEVNEGKHRICVMKRFGYNHRVPMYVTRYERYVKKEILTESSDMEQVLSACYTRFVDLGIPMDAVRKHLQNPKATVMDYLNSSEYSYEEMYERRSNQIMSRVMHPSLIEDVLS